MSFSTQRTSDGTITISPKRAQEQSALVVISHGLGDTAEGFADVAENLARAMPYVKFVLPTAPTQPVTLNMGMSMPSWYDIVGLDERSNENCQGISESQARIAEILQEEHDKFGLPYNRMVLAGFSQGGALSLFTGLQLSQQLAGIVVMSGYVPAAAQLKVQQPSTPILHCHGTQDVIVPYAMAEKSQKMLQSKGVQKYELQSYPIPHTVSPNELAAVKAFLQQVLPPDDTCLVTLPDPSTMSVKELKAEIRNAGLSKQATGLMEKHEFVKLIQDYRQGKL
ncbi:lysophospholipase II [Fistulifera solaris]|uniref:Lysophospholipase II n=1 Tax=Fistulifera solaris TaxID=1519565 RepID=A0A1Z5JCK9_FISSO|nr:lysophospholipase II [Fistulifera solaris]|eukprot:GAX11632.1 lysophospholipase II [Fistulifera solaris]